MEQSTDNTIQPSDIREAMRRFFTASGPFSMLERSDHSRVKERLLCIQIQIDRYTELHICHIQFILDTVYTIPEIMIHELDSFVFNFDHRSTPYLYIKTDLREDIYYACIEVVEEFIMYMSMDECYFKVYISICKKLQNMDGEVSIGQTSLSTQ